MPDGRPLTHARHCSSLDLDGGALTVWATNGTIWGAVVAAIWKDDLDA